VATPLQPPTRKGGRTQKKRKKKKKKKHLPSLPCPTKAMVWLPRGHETVVARHEVMYVVKPDGQSFVARDMKPRSRDMGPQLRDMITWFRDMRSCMCAVHSWRP
jgi:hypothetical protein